MTLKGPDVTSSLPIALDLVAVTILVFGIYFRRHHRRDLVVAFLAVNVGVLGVSVALSSTAVTAGLGLGLFGVLSIIRLRSSELAQHEIAYYFSALALGLLGGITTSPAWLAPALMAALLAVVWFGDHPQLFAGHDTQRVVVDRALSDPDALRTHLGERMDRTILGVSIIEVDLVKDTTRAEVRLAPRGVTAVTSSGPRTDDEADGAFAISGRRAGR